MERVTAPQTKRKIKRESLSVANNEAASKKTVTSRETDDINGPLSNKDSACVCPESITQIAESIGITNVGEEVACSLAEDVSYKIQEIIHASCTLMRQSKRRKLLTSDVNSTLSTSNVSHIFGHLQKEDSSFFRLPEADIYVAEDHEVDLLATAKSTCVPKVKKPSYVATSYPILQSVNPLPVNGHTIKTEGKSISFYSGKSSMVNGDVKAETTIPHSHNQSAHQNSLKKERKISPDSFKKRTTSVENGPHLKSALDTCSKLNGQVRFSSHHGIREKLNRNSEDELIISKAQLSFFNVIAKSVIGGHHYLFQEVLSTLRQSRKANTVSAPLLNFVALSVCHIPRHFGFLSRLLDVVDVLLRNRNICPTHSIAVNRLVNALLAISADQTVLKGKNDFLLRKKSAQLLTRVLLVWGIEEQHVSELLSRVARVLGDGKEKIQSHYGALVIFQSLGKAAIGWLSPILKCFLPLMDKRYPLTSKSSNNQLEEIRGILLDVVEILYCDENPYRFKTKASTVQETQAMIHLDTLLYQYCGDAVCARRRISPLILQQLEARIKRSEGLQQAYFEANLMPHISNRLDFRHLSDCSRKQTKMCSISEVFEETFVVPIARRKDILFKFAGANPVPKDGLRKKILGKTLVQFNSINSNQNSTVSPQKLVLVGRIHRSKCKSVKQRLNVNSLYTVL